VWLYSSGGKSPLRCARGPDSVARRCRRCTLISIQADRHQPISEEPL